LLIFFHGEIDIAKLNRVILYFIPKVLSAVLITEFRPICLLNCSYKIFFKVLANRLQLALGDIIGDAQYAFLNRYILDSVIITHELLHHVHIYKESDLLFKVDFQKKKHLIMLTDFICLKLSKRF
jgi:Reverse transcriptase (RNA-dependent DNA polymerase)